MVASIPYIYCEKQYQKPLQPGIGETYQAYGQDGAEIFYEQDTENSTRFLIEGPNGNYRSHGKLSHNIRPGLISSTAEPNGYKVVTFKDGQEIKFDLIGDSVYNLFFGTIGHQLIGKIEFKDEANKLYAYYQFGAYYSKKQDYFYGEIFKDNKRVSEIEGNYMGFFDIDKKRYWDIREKDKTWFKV